ncbi:non-ribosomal peptide synthetase [Phenylobacterium sp.]|uniref:non-ribosomal peptide synthetase n=1 Tax=Phenylobacterium sp. TaxID=1871053 RepID=UPI0025E19414|nr:non-ribosomal peptide synthetase [Phenylobacterium sp.]
MAARAQPLAPAAGLEGLDWLAADSRPLDWHGPTGRAFARFAEDDLGRPIVGQFERVARRHRDRVAVTDGATTLSYGELWDGLSGLAETLAARTGPGELIGIALPTSPLFPLAMLACLAAGRPFVALDAHAPADWLGQVLADARPALILGVEAGLPGVAVGAAQVLRLAGLPQAAGPGWRPAALGPDEPACVLFTSGSTGRPKGIVNSQRNMLQRVAQSTNAAHITPQDRFLTLASPCTIVGVRDTLTALLAGATLRLLDPGRVGAREILDVVRDEAITVLFAFPALLRAVVGSSAERAAEALRLVRVGGDTTLWSDIDLMRAWLAPEARVQLIYAATEAPMMQWFVDGAGPRDDPRIPIGYPLPGNRLAVIDEDGRPTPPGEVGELVVASPYVALGLWVDGRCAGEDVERHGSGDRVFRTGDLVRQRPDGLLARLGRKDRQVKIRGARVDLDGVEATLRQHPLVRDVGVLARTGGGGGPTLVAYVSAGDGANAGLLDDLRRVMGRAPAPMRPGRFYRVPEIPRLPSSKLDARALLALDEATVRAERARAAHAEPDPGDHIQRAVAQAWQAVLQAPVGDPQDDFFDVGGDSLSAIALMIELEEALGFELPLTLIHEASRFVDLCEALRQRRPDRYVPLVALKPGEGAPPVFIVHGLGGSVAGLFQIARQMAYPGPVIGIQARGLAGREPPQTSVEAMAADYLGAVRARQPQGPYYLCGYSFGGLVAFEMARRLQQAGDEVGLVGLFDTMTSPLRWPPRVWLAVARGRAVRFIARLGAGRTAGGPPRPSVLGQIPPGMLKVAASALVASARHRPGFYPGELTVFVPEGRDPELPSPQTIWRRQAQTLSIVGTGGAHMTMLAAPHAQTTAASLTRCLLAAQSQRS